MSLQKKIVTAFEILRANGFAGVRERIAWNMREAAERRAYRRWLKTSGTITPADVAAMKQKIGRFARRPLISVLLPVYNVDEKWLRLCLDSVVGQVYENWELCIADDHSPGPHVRRVLDEYVQRDPLRIKVSYRPANGHISAASNSALELAAGEFAVLLDHDDELSPDALFWVANVLNEHRDAAMIYSDEDMIDTRGVRSQPRFKPDFSRDLLYSLNLVTHLSAYRTDLMREIGGWRVGFEGSQDYDLALRVIERVREDQIRHIPRVLYHWRAIAGSVALSSNEKPYAHERARDAIREHHLRTGSAASVEATRYNLHRVRYELPDPPDVSIVVYDSPSDHYLRELAEGTGYPAFEIAAVNTSANGDMVSPIGPLASDFPAKAAELNEAAHRSEGQILVFLAAGLVPRGRDWLMELVGLAAQEQVGAVGGKVLSRLGTVAAGGVVLGTGQGLSTAHFGFPADVGGNMERNLMIGNFSAVSASCLAVRREEFIAEGGFDVESFPAALFSVDLCLRLRERGKRIVFNPYAELACTSAYRTSSTLPHAELERLQKKWPQYFAADPFYNPNLSTRDATFSIDA
jgi:GT2 family glycosyltransferase